MKHVPSAVIVCDGGVDLPEGYAGRYGIATAPLMVCWGDELLKSGVDITAEAFYRRLRTDKVHPTTSQPSVGDYLALYKQAVATGLPVLSLHLSAGLSGSYTSAKMAREMLPDADITLVDTGTLSAAMAMQVLVAGDMAARGVPVPAIVAELARIARETDIIYTIDTLEYLRRGGRIGRVAGYIGTLLGLRPVITVDKSTGTYNATGRARSFRAGANLLVDQIADACGEGAEISCIMVHGDCAPEMEKLIERLQARMNCRWIKVVRANPSLGVHVGPDTLGVAFYRGVLPIADADQALAL